MAGLLALLAGGKAFALPVFAHRYGLTCQACHTTVPHLNAFGTAFMERGFRLPVAGREALPIAVKVNLAYSSDPGEGGLPKAVVDEVELLTGGAIGKHLNYFLEQYAIDGGEPGLTRDAWVQYNRGATHVRAGQFTLPLPVDPETQRDTLAHYALYDQTVGDNTFDFFDPRAGIDAYTHNDASGLNAHLAIVNSGLMAYASKPFGNVSLYAYRYAGQGGARPALDAFYRQGYGVSAQHGRFSAVAVLQSGNDSDAQNGLPVRSRGGFLETRYAFSDAFAAVVRHDRVWNAVDGAQNQTVLTLVMRPHSNMRFTIEDQITNHQTLNAALLFAY